MRRRATHGGPVTVLCCDNMASNGRTLRGLVGQFASQVDRGLAAWIDDNVRFPSSMVDRIVPAATPVSLDRAASLLGLRDEAAACDRVLDPERCAQLSALFDHGEVRRSTLWDGG
jgi:fructuronate reductase